MSTVRLMATTYRYEVNKGNPNSMRLQQEAKIAVLTSTLNVFQLYA